MTIQVNVYDAKTQLSKLLEKVAAGERVVIAKNGKPIADLVPHQGSTVIFGGLKGQIVYDEDDFKAADVEIAAMWDPDLGVDIPSASS